MLWNKLIAVGFFWVWALATQGWHSALAFIGGLLVFRLMPVIPGIKSWAHDFTRQGQQEAEAEMKKDFEKFIGWLTPFLRWGPRLSFKEENSPARTRESVGFTVLMISLGGGLYFYFLHGMAMSLEDSAWTIPATFAGWMLWIFCLRNAIVARCAGEISDDQKIRGYEWSAFILRESAAMLTGGLVRSVTTVWKIIWRIPSFAIFAAAFFAGIIVDSLVRIAILPATGSFYLAGWRSGWQKFVWAKPAVELIVRDIYQAQPFWIPRRMAESLRHVFP